MHRGLTGMTRLPLSAFALTLLTAQAGAAGGFTCESGEQDANKVLVEGATPRSEPGLINFGAVLEFDGRKIEFRKSDVKSFVGKNGIIQIHAAARAGEQTYTLRVNVKRNPKDEDDWGGTYEISYTPPAQDKAKPKAVAKRGPVKCFVE